MSVRLPESTCPRILIGCDKSGRLRDRFAALGFDAWSCDLLPTETAGNHYQGDLLQLIESSTEPWLALIAHPPCTFLCVSGMHWTTRGLRDAKLTEAAIAFAERLWAAPVPFICIENPVGVLSTRSRLGRPSQTIQPYQFGDDASKRTCLWLKGLPLLSKDPAKRIPGRRVEWPRSSGKLVERWSNQTDSGQNKLGPSDGRAIERARTYVGIAEAMAEQWGPFLLKP